MVKFIVGGLVLAGVGAGGYFAFKELTKPVALTTGGETGLPVFDADSFKTPPAPFAPSPETAVGPKPPKDMILVDRFPNPTSEKYRGEPITATIMPIKDFTAAPTPPKIFTPTVEPAPVAPIKSFQPVLEPAPIAPVKNFQPVPEVARPVPDKFRPVTEIGIKETLSASDAIRGGFGGNKGFEAGGFDKQRLTSGSLTKGRIF
jgi:hypothetical protein